MFSSFAALLVTVFTQSVALWVVSRSAVELLPQVLSDCSPEPDVNCGPLLEVTSEDVLNRAIQDVMNALATSADVVEDREISDGHPMVRSTMVRR